MNKKTIEERYEKMSQQEYVLARPDSYIGSIELDTQLTWVFDEEKSRFQQREIMVSWGLYKIFDEILVNASDHVVRDKHCCTIKVDIDQEKGDISIYNDGSGIPVEIHKKHKIYVPEMLFGNLLTSENYDEKDKKIVGGKNGYGAKLTNIYSSKFIIETADGKKNYKQVFRDNMYKKEEAEITKSSKSYTKITFRPDYKRFKLNGLTDNIVALFKKRVYDIAVCTIKFKKTKVYLNNEHIKINDFIDYVNLYYSDLPSKPIYENINDRWKVCVLFDNESGYRQISFVNGICTYKGGTHVNHVIEQLVSSISKQILAKNKSLIVKPAYIKDNITVFIDCIIENPDFSSKTKEEMTRKVKDFGSKCEINDKFVQQVIKTGLLDEVIEFSKQREAAKLEKTIKGTKTNSLKGIDKLDDAHDAGTRRSMDCSLILTEGDSAKTFVISGISSMLGRKKYGVFPLRGKLLNVRDVSIQKLQQNKEIENIVKIMGLRFNQKYQDTAKLRYGHVVILTDQDVDGDHIKGLLINFFEYFWPSLVKIKGFIQTLSTPIVKVTNNQSKSDVKVFYNLTDYDNWKAKTNMNKWTSKYYKGLGTHKGESITDCFEDFDEKVVKYTWDKLILPMINEKKKRKSKDKKEKKEDAEDKETVTDETEQSSITLDLEDKSSKCYDALTKAFSKKRANDRKDWLANYDRNIVIDNTQKEVRIDEFIDKTLIHFSNYDNIRSIPSICDGLKPSQRKIMYVAFKRNIHDEKKEVKVAQLAGYVSAESAYHHGETSLQGAIINLAQTFVGSNNINLLYPNGAFGSRLQGGKDAASPRYIFTYIPQLTSLLFRKEDDKILKHEMDDGNEIEPIVYFPILPIVLINGAHGIGTGFSVNIPCYNPLDIINNIHRKMKGKEMERMTPWYRGFTGDIVPNDKSYIVHGKYKQIDEKTLHITELPIETWTDDYRIFLDSLIYEDKNYDKSKDKHKYKDQYVIEKVINDSGDMKVDITVKFYNSTLKRLVKKNLIEKKLKLTDKINITNMHLYDANHHIKRYNTELEIIEEFYEKRLEVYKIRKIHHIKDLRNKLNIIDYKIKFIEYIIDGKIIINKQKKDKIIERLVELKFPELATDINNPDVSFKYLIDMPLFSLTYEKIEDLKEEANKRKKDLEDYENMTEINLWNKEINEFKELYMKIGINIEETTSKKKKRATKKAKK